MSAMTKPVRKHKPSSERLEAEMAARLDGYVTAGDACDVLNLKLPNLAAFAAKWKIKSRPVGRARWYALDGIHEVIVWRAGVVEIAKEKIRDLRFHPVKR
jgi:hypothetical protein